jgi:hypothetical protein
MEVFYGEKLHDTGLNPAPASRSLTFGAVTITAGVIRDGLEATVVALIDVAAESGSSTVENIADDAEVMRRKGVITHVVIAEKTENISDLERRF